MKGSSPTGWLNLLEGKVERCLLLVGTWGRSLASVLASWVPFGRWQQYGNGDSTGVLLLKSGVHPPTLVPSESLLEKQVQSPTRTLESKSVLTDPQEIHVCVKVWKTLPRVPWAILRMGLDFLIGHVSAFSIQYVTPFLQNYFCLY